MQGHYLLGFPLRFKGLDVRTLENFCLGLFLQVQEEPALLRKPFFKIGILKVGRRL